MTAPDATPLDGVPSIALVDVVAGSDRRRLTQLQEVHRRHFPDYPHVLDEVQQGWESGSDDPEIVVHQLLLLAGDQAVGEFVFHTNLRRCMVLRHHLAIDQSARGGLPFGWLRRLTAVVADIGRRDAAAAGRPLLGMMSEISPGHLEGWRRMGYRTFDVGYAEPVHGRYWRDFGPPVFHPLTPIIGLLPDGERVPFREVALAGVNGFLIDQYRLPADEPVVAGILHRTASLPD